MITARVCAVLSLSILAVSCLAQDQTQTQDQAKDQPKPIVPVVSPKEAYSFALDPLLQARQAPDDLTEADKWALGVGIARAADSCKSIADKMPTDENLLDLGQLCLFGQQHEIAADALKRYITLKNPSNLEQGRILLSQAYVNLQSYTSAESQVESLLEEFPYDAKIHFSCDFILDNAEGTKEDPATIKGMDAITVVRRLNKLQYSHTLEALAKTGSISSADNSATVKASQLIKDALRAARIFKEEGDTKQAEKIIDAVKEALKTSALSMSLEFDSMKNALDRYELVDHKVMEEKLRGDRLLQTGTFVKHIASLSESNSIFIAFSFAAPQSAQVIQNIATAVKNKQGLHIYAVTSYMANNGVEEKTDSVVNALKALRSMIPSNVTLMVLPEVELQMFSIDSYPTGAVVGKDRVVHFLEPLTGKIAGINRLLATVPAN